MAGSGWLSRRTVDRYVGDPGVFAQLFAIAVPGSTGWPEFLRFAASSLLVVGVYSSTALLLAEHVKRTMAGDAARGVGWNAYRWPAGDRRRATFDPDVSCPGVSSGLLLRVPPLR